MKILAEELEVRERSMAGGRQESDGSKHQHHLKKGHGMSASFMTGNHASEHCRSVTETEARRQYSKAQVDAFFALRRVT